MLLLFMWQWTYNSTCRPLSCSMHTHHIRAQFGKWLVKTTGTGLTSCSFNLQGDSCIFCRAALFIIKLNTQPSHCTDIFGLSKEVRTWQWFNLEGQLLPQTGSSLTSFQAFLSFWDAHWPCRNTVSDESPTSITLQFRSTWLSSGSYGTQGPQSWMN